MDERDGQGEGGTKEFKEEWFCLLFFNLAELGMGSRRYSTLLYSTVQLWRLWVWQERWERAVTVVRNRMPRAEQRRVHRYATYASSPDVA